MNSAGEKKMGKREITHVVCAGLSGLPAPRELGGMTKMAEISPAQPSPTTEAPETICDECGGRDGNHRQVPDGHGEWDRCVRAPKRTSDVHIDSMPHEIWASGPGCMWSEQEQALRGSVKYIRSDVVEQRVTKAVDTEARKWWPDMRAALGATPEENSLQAARRVVAERDEAVERREGWQEATARALADKEAALARVRELEAKSVHLEQVSKDYREAATSNLEKAETAERELAEARADRDRYKAAQAECWNALESISVLVDPLVKP